MLDWARLNFNRKMNLMTNTAVLSMGISQVFDKVEEILYEETNEKLILAGHLTFELLDNVDFGTDIDDIDEGNDKIRDLYNLLIDVKHGLDSMVVARNSWVC